ncbi:MAG: hypothetical protein ACREV4_11905 [Gammaproteobacteria bacterium]
MRHILRYSAAVSFLASILFLPVYGADTDDEADLLRAEIRLDKARIIKDTMQFSDAEAEKFWPVYNAYAGQLTLNNDELKALIQRYFKIMNAVDEKTAKELVGKAIANEEKELDLMTRFFPRFAGAIGAPRAAKFYQVDRQLNRILRAKIASLVPLAKPF